MSQAGTRWLCLWSLLGLLFLGGLLFKCYWPDHGLYDVTGHLLGRDFVNVWMAAHLLRDGQVATAYDLHGFIAAMRGVFGDAFPFHNWSYPPSILPFVAPFGWLAYGPALILWSLLGLTAFLLTTRGKATLLLATSPAALVNLLSGQNGFFTAACFLGGFTLLARRPVTAGILFGLLTIKPQLGILIPFALILLGQWRAFATATVAALTLAAFSTVLWGPGLWHAYFSEIAAYQQMLLHSFHGFYATMMPGPYAAARTISLPHEVAMTLHLAVTFIAAIAGLGILRREGTSPRAILALAIATMLVTPYGYNYDLTAIAGALVAYLLTIQPDARERMLYGLLWLLPAATFSLMPLHLPLAPLILLAPLLYLARQSASAASSG
jgi:hypothetical protein